jgi:hypothetical protein
VKKPGRYHGFVELPAEDGFTLDNRRWLAFDARPPDRLLLVDGEPGTSMFGNETYYLEAALRLSLADQGPPQTPYEPVRWAWSASQSLPDVSAYSAVLLCNVPGLSEADSQRLERYVAGGGQLLIFAGAKLRPEGYAGLQRAGLLPATIGQPSDPALFRWQTWNKDHPIFRPLSDPQQGDLRRLAFRRIAPLSPPPKPTDRAEVLAAADSGDPLLVEKQRERGRVLLFASTADREWGDWPQSRLFVPLIHQIADYLTHRLPEHERVRNELAGSGPDDVPRIQEVGDRSIVRNLDPRESRFERCTVKEFRAAFQLPDAPPPADAASRSAAAGPAGSQRPDESWPSVVWSLVLVLVLEMLVANRSHA